jgi:hypothetical protein
MCFFFPLQFLFQTLFTLIHIEWVRWDQSNMCKEMQIHLCAKGLSFASHFNENWLRNIKSTQNLCKFAQMFLTCFSWTNSGWRNLNRCSATAWSTYKQSLKNQLYKIVILQCTNIINRVLPWEISHYHHFASERTQLYIFNVISFDFKPLKKYCLQVTGYHKY